MTTPAAHVPHEPLASTPQPSQSPSQAQEGQPPSRERAAARRSAVPAERGRLAIADGVVEKIAGLAAREVPGVYALGGQFARTLGAVRERVPGRRQPDVTQGVKVEVGERQAAADLNVVVEYGLPIADIAARTRANVIEAVERMTGLEVVEVNIAVTDVHLPDEDPDQDPDPENPSGARVR
ncbi:Asp23/Gls24 family envelope stress response protein [Streptomyces iconiensis]|uniref:Asp23/Gls24 family envelope stress response protein n=1 Tax=Streptomyces iconiensis TaxID=1384038 RepID=A0ABT6ZR04_9ACTN|nr:Asp23/Gls24 family envelope stress response protein [Streptomyces iconiensis]MDJ1131495.1 Asp23/Gls24 family envelope stress response protein [Streptomyces iconiensis]